MQTSLADPNLMTPTERLKEIAVLLARGFLRSRAPAWGRRSEVDTGDLTFPCEQSVHPVTRK